MSKTSPAATAALPPAPSDASLPGAHLDAATMPGHWLLARLGKRVLRPGGLALTRAMLDGLAVRTDDAVVEFAPGLGVTTRMTLARDPARYTAVERDPAAAARVKAMLHDRRHRCVLGSASSSGLGDVSATVVYGEAMLSMHTATQKATIVREAFRLLKPGGRYGIHELSLTPDTLDEATREAIARDLSQSLRVGARPLTRSEWCAVLEGEGFVVDTVADAPMHLLEPRRIVQDEGLAGALRIAANVARDPAARRRVLQMRAVFQRYARQLGAIAVVARKP